MRNNIPSVTYTSKQPGGELSAAGHTFPPTYTQPRYILSGGLRAGLSFISHRFMLIDAGGM
jgi:hypothetical protein